MKGANDRVRAFFARCVQDVTPASARRVACVLYAPLTCNAEVARDFDSILSHSEQDRAQRFVAESDRLRFRQRRAFRRYCAARALGSASPLLELAFTETANGRPYLRDATELWFSFSSCPSGLLGAWSSTHAIGVDIEDPTRALEATELARTFFSAAEARAVESAHGTARQHTFLRLWGLKEAALKSIGEGLPFGLDAFEFELHPAPRVVCAPREQGGPERFEVSLLEAGGHCAALAIRAKT